MLRPLQKSRTVVVGWALVLAMNFPGIATAQPMSSPDFPQRLVWAVFAFLGLEQTLERYAPLADYLNETLDGYSVELRVLPIERIYEGIERGEFDFVTTNPTHFLVVRQQFPLSGVLATLSSLDDEGNPQRYLSGCIVVLAEREDLQILADVRGQRIATPSLQHMGGYRAQAFELYLAGVRLPDHAKSIQQVGVHQEAIRLLLRREVDVAFVRSGIIEDMVRRGELDLSMIRVINPLQFESL